MNAGRILYEDKDIIVCHKAAGIATQTARVGQADMVSEVTNYLMHGVHDDRKAQKEYRQSGVNTSGRPAVPYLGVVHRLDQPVEGILVFAKTRRAAAELTRQITENRMEKYYCAIVCARDFVPRGTLADYLLKDGRTNISRIVPPEVKGAKKAVLDYEILPGNVFSLEEFMAGISSQKDFMKQFATEGAVPQGNLKHFQIALARIRLHTGRHHQIRAQMGHAGMALLGDYKYASPEIVEISGQMHIKEIALCAHRLVFRHPVTGDMMRFQVDPEGKCFRMGKGFDVKESNNGC